MTEQHDPSSPDALRAFLWGKRQSRRHAAALDVQLRGALHPISALSLDLSACGVLLRVPMAALEPSPSEHGMVDPFVLVQTHFRGPCIANFKRQRVKVHFETVRLDFRSEEPDHLFIGCRFSRPLDRKQLARFGLSPDEVGPEPHGLPSEMVPLRAADDPVICRILGGIAGEQVLYEGRIQGLGSNTLCLRLDDVSVETVAAALRGAPFYVGVLEGDTLSWRSPAQLQTIGFLEEGGSLELGLVLAKKTRRRLRARFAAA